MSIYAAIEVLKWFQVRLVKSDADLMRDPGSYDISMAALGVTHAGAAAETKVRNMVKITNTEIIENLG